MSRSRSLSSRALGLAAALVALPVAAQEPPAAAVTSPPPAAAAPPAATEPAVSEAEGRVLNDHVFVAGHLVRGPHVTTSFATEMVLIGGSTTGTITIRDQTLSGSLDFAGLGGFAGYEYAFFDNLSARVWLEDLVYSGLSGTAVAVLGSEVQAGFGGGLTASMKLGDTVRLGALLDVSYAPSVALTIADALQNIADSCSGPDGCNLDTASAIEIENVLDVRPSIALAFAPFASLGLTANVAYVHLDGDGSTGTADGVKLGTAVDFDLDPVANVPVGLQVQGTWTAPVGESSLQHLTDVGVGISYTGRRDLYVGVQVLGRRFSLQPGIADTSWSAFLTTIGLRYYW